MTINKAQGQTIHNVGLYLPLHVLSHGQLYVALSRGISMSTTKALVLTEQSKRHNGTYTKNIVYEEVLDMICIYVHSNTNNELFTRLTTLHCLKSQM